MKHIWRPEHPAGHERYCVNPGGHSSVTTFCRADTREPETMHGGPSRAWHEDHPEPPLTSGMNRTVILMNRFGTGSLADVEVFGPYGDHEDVEAIADLYRDSNSQATVEVAPLRR